MADAQYELTTGSLIDTIFVFEIGGQYINVNKEKGTIQFCPTRSAKTVENYNNLRKNHRKSYDHLLK